MCTAIFLVQAEALNALEILLFADLQSLAFVAVEGNVGLSEVDKAEFVLRVEFGAERRFESGSARAAAEGIADVVFRSDRVDSCTECKSVFFVLGGQRRQRWELWSGSDGDSRFKGTGVEIT